MEKLETNLSVICPFNDMTCPIMEDLTFDQRTLRVCEENCDIDVKEIFVP